MGILQKSFIAATIGLAMAVPAVSEEIQLQTSTMSAVSVAGLKEQNFLLYDLGEQVLSTKSTKHARAIINKVLGITCEWIDSGHREANADAVFHTVDITAQKIGCVASTDIPEKWNSVSLMAAKTAEEIAAFYQRQGMPADLSQHRATSEVEKFENAIGEVSTNPSTPAIVKELIRPDDMHGLPGVWIMHEWNLASEQVCLKTLNIPSERDKSVSRTLDWGCYAVTNKDYMNRVADAAGLTMG